MQIVVIAAMTKDRVIGINNSLPWKITEELKYFREITLNKPIIMGSNTFRSINMRPLKDRHNIVLTSDPEQIYSEFKNKFNNLIFVNDLNDSLLKAKEFYEVNNKFDLEPQVMVIGGEQIYQQFLRLADLLYLSIIKQSYNGNTFFPEYDFNLWQLISSQEHEEFIAEIWRRKK